MEAHLPIIDWATAETVAKSIRVAHDSWMQDWPLEVADANRIEEFISHYDSEKNRECRIAIAVLIAESLNDAVAQGAASSQVLHQAGSILKNHPDIIEYWACRDAATDDEMFFITPWVRSL
jgi:hypothetical protein